MDTNDVDDVDNLYDDGKITDTVPKDIKDGQDRGDKILSENSFFKDFIGLMQNSSFNDFYNEYFQTWSDIETMIFYMKVYKAVEYGYVTHFHVPIDMSLMTFILHKIMTTTSMRRTAISIFRDSKNGDCSDNEVFCKLLNFNRLKNEKMLK